MFAQRYSSDRLVGATRLRYIAKYAAHLRDAPDVVDLLFPFGKKTLRISALHCLQNGNAPARRQQLCDSDALV